jgi:hypothetical protein
MPSGPGATHVWNFSRSGGLDQVVLGSGADLLALDELDQKLWVALGCPVKGLELDEKTLALVDTDGDGRIGAPDVIAAVKWAAGRLNDVGEILEGADTLPLSSVNGTEEGGVLVASATKVLATLGRRDAAGITVAEATGTASIFAGNPLNGDGIIPPEATDDPAVQKLITEIIGCLGGTARATGLVGVTAEAIESFFSDLSAYVAWIELSSTREIAVLGEATEAACNSIRAVRPKVEDFFARCQLAAFDARSIDALNRSEADYVAIASKDLAASADAVRGFPLAHIGARQSLPLLEGVNPAWAAELAALHERAVAPVFGRGKTSLTSADWSALTAKVAAYETWLGAKAGSAVEKVGVSRAKEILGGKGRAELSELVARDRALGPEFKALSDVERLARYYRDLRTLLCNFVNFADFYSRDRYAAFQAGTLFLDSRSTELCLRVDGASPLAAMSKAYIAYCSCTRADGATMTIAACFTQGSGDYLFVGRNGVLYDRLGVLWYATITSIVDNPISIRAAFWSPYKKFIRLIEEQVAKRAAAADTGAVGKLAAAAGTATEAEKPKPPSNRFDLAVITGIGVAIGSIGTFLATVFAKFVELPGWQLPLIVVGLVLVISLPSMFIAALKLRQRTLGPILEANGWAINGRVRITIPFGAALTRLAKLPEGARHSEEDTYGDGGDSVLGRGGALFVGVLVLAALALWIRWDHNQRGHYFWEGARVGAIGRA